MNLVRINDTPQFCWGINEEQTVKLIRFLKEIGAKKIPYHPDKGLKLKGNEVDTYG